ncbi:hypothetical protein ACJMK2_030444, partial [Sinanodonta woodiana]
IDQVWNFAGGCNTEEKEGSVPDGSGPIPVLKKTIRSLVQECTVILLVLEIVRRSTNPDAGYQVRYEP